MIGISIRTTNEGGQASQDIAALWQTFIAEKVLEKIPNKLNQEVYSLYTDYEGDHTEPYSAIIGCQVKSLDQIPSGMVGQSFRGGTYVKLSAKGDLLQGLVLKQWQDIFGMRLDRTYDADFEVFGEKAKNPSAAEVDFYVGVKPESYA